MAEKHRHVVNHTFRGGRFEDHGIDLDVLPDVLRYKQLLVEVAKELWRRTNPDRERLPKKFEDSLSLRFYEVQCNCATIPLERELDRERIQLWESEDELDDAVDLVAQTIDAAGKDESLPDAFPKHLLSLFQEYGKTLRDDEWIEHRPARRETAVRYDANVRQRLTRWATAAYEDVIDLVGEVTMARVSRPRMALQLADGREVEAAFRPQDEAAITTALKQHETARLRVIGRGQFAVEGLLQKIIEVQEVRLLADGQPAFDVSAKPIWEEFDEILSGVPDQALSALPVDGAERHDFYIYGAHEGGA